MPMQTMSAVNYFCTRGQLKLILNLWKKASGYCRPISLFGRVKSAPEA